GGLLFYGVSCSSSDAASNFTHIPSSDSIVFRTIQIDTLELKPPAFSGVGFLKLHNGRLYFFDKVFGVVNEFDLTGQFIKRGLGLGEGPAEVPSIMMYAPMGNKHFVLEKSWTFDIYDSTWHRIKRAGINWDDSKPLKELENNPQPTDRGIYEIEYEVNNILPLDSSRILLSITSDHPRFNGYFTPEFYSEARIFGVLNTKTGKIERLVGEKSPMYGQYRFIPNFDFCYGENLADSIMVNFEPDSLIYVYNPVFGKSVSFGRAGKDMAVSYPQTKQFDEAENRIIADRETYGYYTRLKYLQEKQLVFRSYKKGKDAASDGLQIYSADSKKLFGDIEVPKKFEVLGSDGDAFFATGIIDELNNRLAVFRFKLL
ncbi:MAG: hypothetical protein ABW007_24145, partial [Chitinophagaceae bacterium]